MDAIQLSLPFEPEHIEDVYVDQAMVNMNVCDRNFFSAYTPFGIRQIDSEFCRRIQNLIVDQQELRRSIIKRYLSREEYKKKGAPRRYLDERYYALKRARAEALEQLSFIDEDPADLREDIICNEHLHPYIKKNLLENLDSYLIRIGRSIALKQVIGEIHLANIKEYAKKNTLAYHIELEKSKFDPEICF